MYKTFLSIIFLFAVHSACSQDSASYLYKSNPLRPLWGQVPFTGEYSLSIEKVLDTRFSYQLSFSVVTPSPLNNVGIPNMNSNVVDINIIGARVRPSLRFYFYNHRKSAPSGLYWGPMISLNLVRFADRDIQGDYLLHRYSSVNILLGYQLLVFKGFYLDLFSGVGYKYNTWKRPVSFGSIFTLPEDEQGIKYTLGFEIGLAGRKKGREK